MQLYACFNNLLRLRVIPLIHPAENMIIIIIINIVVLANISVITMVIIIKIITVVKTRVTHYWMV